MKILASTNGNFMLRSTSTGEELAWNRIGLVTACNFYMSRIADGSVKLWARDIPDSATDKQWADWLKASEGNEELAVASFVSQFEPKAEEPTPA